MSLAPTRRPAGFTLVELLVVIGIIALLISILLPALNKAREASRQVKCLSNMQQIAKAVMMFSAESNGRMPAAGGGNSYWFNSSNGSKGSVATLSGTAASDQRFAMAEWLPWRRAIDPISGVANSGNATVYDLNITYGALTKFLGGKVIDTTGDFNAANNVARNLDELFRCPSDNLDARPKADTGGRGAYRYSFSYNRMWAGDRAQPGQTAVRGEACADGVTTEFSKFTGKLASIKRPGEKILIICEDEQTLDDNLWTHDGTGGFNATSNWVAGSAIGALSSRHEAKRKNASSGFGTNASVGLQDARGNAAFCDGHVEFISRKEALSQRRTGNPLPDHPDYYALKRN